MIYCKAKPSTAGGVKLITMIAVGVGIAPMIHTLRAIFRHRDSQLRSIERADSPSPCQQSRNIRVKLLYGVVSTVSDYSDFLYITSYINIKFSSFCIAHLRPTQREVADILLREQLEEWRIKYEDIFSVLYCVGKI
jgi:hypothetical protein